jgi:hypothetical protein
MVIKAARGGVTIPSTILNDDHQVYLFKRLLHVDAEIK